MLLDQEGLLYGKVWGAKNPRKTGGIVPVNVGVLFHAPSFQASVTPRQIYPREPCRLLRGGGAAQHRGSRGSSPRLSQELPRCVRHACCLSGASAATPLPEHSGVLRRAAGGSDSRKNACCCVAFLPASPLPQQHRLPRCRLNRGVKRLEPKERWGS